MSLPSSILWTEVHAPLRDPGDWPLRWSDAPPLTPLFLKVAPCGLSARREAQLTALAWDAAPGRVPAPWGARGRTLALTRVPGLTLQAALQGRVGGLGAAHVSDICDQLAQTLACLHASGLCHGDLKPSNVIWTPRAQVVLMDFGQATSGGPQPWPGASGTGRPGYAHAPAVWLGGPQDAGTDRWSLAALRWRLEVGHRGWLDWAAPLRARPRAEVAAALRSAPWA